MSAHWEGLAEGAGPPPWTVGPITLTDVVRYQGASGDFNPIHHDPDFARGSGFERPLVVGMYQAGVLNTYATRWLGPENVRRTKVRWKTPLFPGDTITCAGKVARKYEADGERRVDLDLVCTNQDGAVAVEAAMTFVVP